MIKPFLEKKMWKKKEKKICKLGFYHCMLCTSIISPDKYCKCLSMFGHSMNGFPSGTCMCSNDKFTSELSKWRTKWNTNSTDDTTVQMMRLYQPPPPIKGDCTAVPMAHYEINFVFHDWNIAMCNSLKLLCINRSYMYSVFLPLWTYWCCHPVLVCTSILWSPQCPNFSLLYQIVAFV